MTLRNDCGFHEYTYQDREYIIRAMNIKHAQYIQMVTKLNIGCTYDCTLSLWAHLWSSCNSNQL